MRNVSPILKTFVILPSLLISLSAEARPSYRSALRHWTRSDRVYSWDNLEARVIWHATYLSPDFLEACRKKLGRLLFWSEEEQSREEEENRRAGERYDSFFVSIYAGSSQWSEIGKDEGLWRFLLETEGRKPVKPVSVERIPITQVERTLYPYLDKWSHAYVVRFARSLPDHGRFHLRMAGVPAASILTWEKTSLTR